MSKRPKRAYFVVGVDLPDGMSKADMRKYIIESVGSMSGIYEPDDPRFNIKSKSISAKHLANKTAKNILNGVYVIWD